MLKRLVEVFRDAAFPRRCNGCEKLFRPAHCGPADPATGDLGAIFAAGMADGFCDACAEATWIRSPLCTQCGLPFKSSQSIDHLCSRCMDTLFSFDEARAAGTYSHGLRAMLQDFKYRGHVHLAMPLGRLLWATLMKNWHPADFDQIIPVPLHHRRLFLRGFNQAELLVRCWPRAAKEAGIDLDGKKIATRLMVRHRYTASQTGLGRPQREANLRQAFRLKEGHRVRGLHILLVDDVYTTGATADACSRVLIRCGAASVKVLTLARTV